MCLTLLQKQRLDSDVAQCGTQPILNSEIILVKKNYIVFNCVMICLVNGYE